MSEQPDHETSPDGADTASSDTASSDTTSSSAASSDTTSSSAELPPSAKKISRTWPQRLTISAAFALAFAAFGAAGGLYAGQRIVEDRNIAPPIVNPALQTAVPGANDDESAPPATFPLAEPDAKNFLITGADNNSRVDADSPYAPAFGDRSGLGERSDTIMMWRVNPGTAQVAVLSFPRDLFVDIAGTTRKGRINEAYERDNPQKLIDTIYQNFAINTDHFVQVDFCAFQTLVDAVGGVAVPFDTPVRDPNTGLNVTESGCFNFNGDHALAYVRSRKLQYLDPQSGQWEKDGTSDLGRISRQQDFLRRIVSRLLSKGAFNPDVAGGLIETVSEYIVTDRELTPRKMLEFAGVMSGVDPDAITTYQINADPKTIQGNDVLVPTLGGDNMQAILAVMRGEAKLGEAPAQVTDTTTPPTSDQPPVIESTTIPGDASSPAVTTGPTTTLPIVAADENQYGVVPDKNISC